MSVPARPKSCPQCSGHVLKGIISPQDYFLVRCPHCQVTLLWDEGRFMEALDVRQNFTEALEAIEHETTV